MPAATAVIDARDAVVNTKILFKRIHSSRLLVKFLGICGSNSTSPLSPILTAGHHLFFNSLNSHCSPVRGGVVSGQCDKNGGAPRFLSQCSMNARLEEIPRFLLQKSGNIHGCLPFFSFSLEIRFFRCSEKLPIFQIIEEDKPWPASAFPLADCHVEYFLSCIVLLLKVMYINSYF